MNKMPISLLLFVSLYLNQSFRDNVNKVADDILYILVRETSVQRKRHLILKLTVGIRILLDVESKVLSELFHLPQKHQAKCHKITKRNATKSPNHLVNSFIFIIFVRIWRMGN